MTQFLCRLTTLTLLQSYNTGLKCKIAKLFAKHFKVQDQIDLLSKQYFPVAVGTPNRLAKLVELGALSLSRVKVISQFFCVSNSFCFLQFDSELFILPYCL